MNKIATLLIIPTIALCQPGKPLGPGGQYGNRMEMMMVWKMTEYLNLTEDQAEKLFPRMRRQRVQMKDYFDNEKELFEKLRSNCLRSIKKLNNSVISNQLISIYE